MLQLTLKRTPVCNDLGHGDSQLNFEDTLLFLVSPNPRPYLVRSPQPWRAL